jgi:hypothetical protein
VQYARSDGPAASCRLPGTALEISQRVGFVIFFHHILHCPYQFSLGAFTNLGRIGKAAQWRQQQTNLYAQQEADYEAKHKLNKTDTGKCSLALWQMKRPDIKKPD